MHAGALLAAIVVSGAAWLPAEAQQQRPQGQEQEPRIAPADSAALVFEREVFMYPTFARRNPFRPLSAMSETGPSFESLQLIGVTSSADPSLSVASLAVGAPSAGGASRDGYRSYRVRVGDVLGNARVLEIHRMRVVFEVEEFGVRERRSLEVMKPTDAPTEVDTIPENNQGLPDEDEVPPDSVPIPDEGGSK